MSSDDPGCAQVLQISPAYAAKARNRGPFCVKSNMLQGRVYRGDDRGDNNSASD